MLIASQPNASANRFFGIFDFIANCLYIVGVKTKNPQFIEKHCVALTISQADYRDALRVNENTVCRRFSAADLAYSGGRNRRYNLAEVLPTLKPKEKDSVPILFAAAKDDGSIVVPDRALQQALALDKWLAKVKDTGARRRWAECRMALASSMGSFRDGYLTTFYENLRWTVIHHPVILRYVLLADASGLPRCETDRESFYRMHALVNSRHEDILEIENA